MAQEAGSTVMRQDDLVRLLELAAEQFDGRLFLVEPWRCKAICRVLLLKVQTREFRLLFCKRLNKQQTNWCDLYFSCIIGTGLFGDLNLH